MVIVDWFTDGVARWRLGAADKRRLGTAFRVVCVVGTILALAWYVRGLDLRALGESFVRATPVPLVLALLANLVAQHIRATGWLVMLDPGHRVPFGRLIRHEFTAQAASTVTPARAGEVVRIWLLKHYDDVPVATVGALIVLKKLFEALGLVILVGAAPWLLPGVPRWVVSTVVLFALGLLLLLAVLVVAARRVRTDQPPTILRRLVGGMHVLRDTRRTLAVLALAVLGEAADLAAVVAVLRALDIEVSLAAAGLVLFLIDLTNLLPSAPGHLGTFEVGALSAFDFLPVDTASAVAFALIFHLQQVLPQTMIGLPFLLRLPLDRRRRPAPAGAGKT